MVKTCSCCKSGTSQLTSKLDTSQQRGSHKNSEVEAIYNGLRSGITCVERKCHRTAEIEDYYCGYRTHIHRAASVLSLGGLL